MYYYTYNYPEKGLKSHYRSIELVDEENYQPVTAATLRAQLAELPPESIVRAHEDDIIDGVVENLTVTIVEEMEPKDYEEVIKREEEGKRNAAKNAKSMMKRYLDTYPNLLEEILAEQKEEKE